MIRKITRIDLTFEDVQIKKLIKVEASQQIHINSIGTLLVNSILLFKWCLTYIKYFTKQLFLFYLYINIIII